jgi:hypothetical protein
MVLDALVEVVASKYRAFSQPLSHRQGVVASQGAEPAVAPARNSVLLCWRVRRAPVNGMPVGSDVKIKGRNHLRHLFKINDLPISFFKGIRA